MTAERSCDRRDVVAVVALVVAVVFAFYPLLSADFINMDDGAYVTANSFVRQGISWEGFRWSLTTHAAQNWHPVAWWSHMLDVHLFGVDPRAAHAVNLALHAFNAVLVYILFRMTTGRAGPSSLTAGLFALHPLAVESVAWISERKNVLSTFLGLLCLCAYARYARRPSVMRYCIVTVLFALSLAAKPMLVTLPFVLLLIDYWPLGRFDVDRSKFRRFGELLAEKMPLLALTIGSCAATLSAQKTALAGTGSLPLTWRLANAVCGYATYLRQATWPVGLMIPYPHPLGGFDPVHVAVCAVVLLGICIVVWKFRRPEAVVGWLWYLGTLVPVIGLIQVGKQATADRYAYVPLIGVFLAVSFLAADWLGRIHRKVLVGVAAMMLVALGMLTHRQSTFWSNSESLFSHSLAIDSNNPMAAYLLGMALAEKKDPTAKIWLRRAVEVGPTDLQARMALGQYLTDQGDAVAAVRELDRAIELAPQFAEPRLRRGIAYAKSGDMSRASADFDAASQLEPSNADPWFNQGLAQLAMGRVGLAELAFEQAIQRDPNLPLAHLQLGLTKFHLGDSQAGLVSLHRAVRVAPPSVEAVNTLAWVLATHPDEKIRNGASAVEWIEPIARSATSEPSLLDTLAAAYAAAGRFDEALKTARDAERLAKDRGNLELAGNIRRRIESYTSRRAYRDESLAPIADRKSPAP